MRRVEFKIFRKQNNKDKMNNDEKIIRAYLEKESPVAYGEHAFEATVHDVLSLDPDLKEYVLSYLQSKETTSQIRCECASISDLLQTERFTPITAALFIQWYRREPVGAASFLMHHDALRDIPENFTEKSEDE